MKRRLLVLFLPALFFMAGCTIFAPKPFSPVQTEFPAGLSPHDILRVLKERNVSHPNLWAAGKITLSGKGIKGKKYFNATLLYQEPDRLRLRGSRMITSTLFEFILNADDMALVLNRDKQWFQGKRGELRESPEATLGIDPTFLPKALLIQQEFTRLLENGRFKRWRRSGDDYLFVTDDREEPRAAFRVQKDNLLVKEAGIYRKDGTLATRLKYRYYDFFHEEVLPGELEAWFPATGVKARIQLSEYKRPLEFHSEVFNLDPPRGYRLRPLRQLLEPPR